MSSTTGFFGLQKLQSGDALSTNDYAFTNRNIDVIDRLLGKIDDAVFENDTPLDDPTDTLSLEVVTTGGLIPAGRTVRFKYTYVDAFGNESAASPESTVGTAAPIARPSAAGLEATTTGGTLLAGNYFYILSAYSDVNTNETSGSPAASLQVRTGSTNKITLTLPSLPAGADGFNIFRRGPGEVQFYYLDSVDMDVATPPSTYEDDNSVTVTNSRTPSATNLTNSTNLINVTLPGATPSVPDGYTWKLYRTFVSGDYNSSLLEWVVTEVDGAIVPYTVDSGLRTTIGVPPSISSLTGATSRITTLETDVAAIEATLGTDPEAGFADVAQVIAYLLANEWSQEAIEDLVAAMFVDSAHGNATVVYSDEATPSGMLVIDVDGGFSQEQIEDIVAAMFVDSAHVNASVSYSDEATPSGQLVITGENGFTQEEIEDIVAAMFVDSAHVNATVTYSDEATPSGLLVIEASAAGYTQEEIEDIVAAMFVDSAHVSATVTYDDGATPSGRLVVDASGLDWIELGLDISTSLSDWGTDKNLVNIGGVATDAMMAFTVGGSQYGDDGYNEIVMTGGPNSEVYVDIFSQKTLAGEGGHAGVDVWAQNDANDIYSTGIFRADATVSAATSTLTVESTDSGVSSQVLLGTFASDAATPPGPSLATIHIQGMNANEDVSMIDHAFLRAGNAADSGIWYFAVLGDGSLVLRSQDDGSLWKLLVSSSGVLTTTSYTP